MKAKAGGLLSIISCWIPLAGQDPAPSQVDILDIKDPIYLLDPMLLLYLGIGILVAAALVWLAITLFKRMTRPPELPPVPPHVIALNRIRKARHWLDPATAERFCTEVSAAMRQFIENHHNLPATEQTTEEFFSNPEHTATFSPSQKVELQRFSEQCDLAKFARWGLGLEEMENLYGTAEQFIETTVKPTGSGHGPRSDSLSPA